MEGVVFPRTRSIADDGSSSLVSRLLLDVIDERSVVRIVGHSIGRSLLSIECVDVDFVSGCQSIRILFFELVDDLLDLTGDPSMGKPRGTDVHEGKMTLPIIHALTMLHSVEREQLADVLQNFSDDRWGELTELLESAGSFEYAKQLIQNHIDRAQENLEALPDSDAKALIIEIAKRSRGRRT